MEVRTYRLKNYQNEDLYILETKGKKPPRDFVSQIIGIIRFDEDFEHKDLSAFRADAERHCIAKGSTFDWDPTTTPKLFGWVVASSIRLPNPKPPPKVKGMIGAKATSRRATLPDIS